MQEAVRRRRAALIAVCCLLAGAAVNAAAGDVELATWPPSFSWHTFHGSADPESGGEIAVDSASRVTAIGSSYASWLGPGGEAPLRAFTPGVANGFVLQVDRLGANRWHTFYGTGTVSARGLAVLGSDIWVAGSSSAGWAGPAGEPLRSPYLAPPANPNTILALQLRGDGAYAWHAFLGSGGTAGNAVVTDGLSVYLAADCWAAWNGPGGEPPVTPFSGWSSAALVALAPNGAYRGHTFVGASTGAEGVAVRSGAVYLGGTTGGSWDGPDGQAPLHAYTGSGDVMLAKLVSPLPFGTLSRRLARRP